MPTLTTNQKIAIALSVPVAGVLFYFLLKWAREDEELEDDTNNEEDFVSSSDMVSELQIPQCHVGVVIGRGGCVIKQIQKESETRINFKDDNEESGDELTEEAKPRSRTMVIRGSRERIKHAEVLIKKIIDEQPVMEKISVEIPQRVIGRIIGKGGKTIRQLCRISGAKLKLDSENETGDSRKCDIIGTQAQIECAKQLIDEKIAEDKEFRSRRKSTQEAKDKLTFAHLPVHGDYFGVYVSAIDTPGHFWVQNVTKDSKLLDNLVEQMTQFYGDRGLGHNLIPPKVGDLCCATFQHDESWYRGEIVQVMEDKSEVRIHYLDFGDTGVVSMANVKEIRKEYCDLSFHAVEVYLANVTPKGDKWSREACVAFEKLSSCAKWEVLMAKVMYYDDNGVPCIELIDTNTENDVNIEKELVDQGFAVYKEKISNPEIEDHSKASTSPFQTSGPVGDEVIAKEEEITVQHMNEQFQTPAFENARFNMDESELCSPITPSNEDISRVNDKDIVREPTIAPAEQKVVSCADISQLESLLGMLNVDESMTDKEATGRLFENLIEESEVKEMDFEGTPLRTRDEINDLSNAEQYNSENLNQERGRETGEALLISEKFHEKQDGEENFEKDDPAANHLDRGEKVSELPVTSSVNLQQNFMEPITVSNVQFTESVPENDMVRNNGEKSVNGNLFNISFTNDRPVNPEYKLDHDLETDPKSTSTPNQDEDVDALDTVPEPADHTDYGLRRSCSEDLTNDDTLTDGGLSKSSSEITMSPHKDEECSKIDNKTPLSSRSLGSISSASPRGKRVLAANFGQIANNSKHESDDDSDGDSLYLSAKEDSDSTGFLSAVGSRSNLQLFDTDSDATPSGYLSEPDDDSMETIETTNVDDQERLDTTLLVEKLKQYADK